MIAENSETLGKRPPGTDFAFAALAPMMFGLMGSERAQQVTPPSADSRLPSTVRSDNLFKTCSGMQAAFALSHQGYHSGAWMLQNGEVRACIETC